MNLRKRIFLVITSILVLVGLVACQTDKIVTLSFSEDEYVIKAGTPVMTDVVIDAGSAYDANTIRTQLAYSSANENIVKMVDGMLLGVGEGETTVKVEWTEKPIVFGTAKVKVLVGEAPTVIFTEYSTNMLKGATQTIGWEFDTVYTDATVRWESANEDIATVDQNGKVKALALGEATIIAYSVLSNGSEKASVLKLNVTESDFGITYVLNGGTNAEGNPAGFNTLELPLELLPATKTGYKFVGWFSDEELTTACPKIVANTQEDVTVYAKWELVEYTITYNLDGGTNAEGNPSKYTVESEEITLLDATKDGFKFLGWFSDAELKTQVTKISGTGDVVLYASFEIDSFKITYDLDGGRFMLPYAYQSHLEVVKDFVKDFNAQSGKTVTVTVKEDGSYVTDFFARSWDGGGNSLGYKFLTDENYSAKWAWMLQLINANRVARGSSELKADDGQAEARGDIHNFLGLLSPENAASFGGNASFGGDYSALTFEGYAAEYLEKVEGALEAPKEYSPAKGTVIPDPVKDEYTFVGWSTKGLAATINTTANSNFWGVYATEIFLFKNGGQNPTFSFRVGLLLNDDGTYRVDRVAQSGAAFDASNLDAELVISESYNNWGSTAAFRAAIQVGQTCIIDGDLNTGKATLKFFDVDLVKDPATSIDTTANSGYWSVFANNVFLFPAGSITNATYSFRVGIVKDQFGNYSVASIGQSGAAFSTEGLAYAVVISDSHDNVASFAAFKEAVKVGQIVKFEGDPKTGTAKVRFFDLSTIVPAGTEGDLNLAAVFVKVKDEQDLSYDTKGGTLSEGAPLTYLSSTGLVLTATAEKAGYTFKGWSKTEGGAIITEIPAGTRGEIKLYAVYEAIDYTITYELNGGVFSVDTIEYIYEDFDALVADFLKDYETKFGLSGLTATNFFTKSNSYGLVSFFKDDALATKWEFLTKFMLGFNPSYSGLNYMKNPSSASNYNKYWRANLAAFFQQTKLTSPLTMDFTGIDNDAFWEKNVPTKVVTVAANPEYSYNGDKLPMDLAAPTKGDVEFIGWCDNEYLKRPFTTLPAGTIGDIKLYAKWADSTEGVEMKNITYELNGGELPEGTATQYETGKEFTLPTPTKAGYKFVKWTLDGKDVTAISAESFEDVTVTAHWTVETYNITYVLGEASYENVIEGYAPAVVESSPEVSVQVTKVGGYYSYYKTDIMLYRNSKASFLYADKIAIDKVDGVWQVVAKALAGSSLDKEYAYVLLTHSEYEHYNDENVQALLAVEVGQILAVTGDMDGDTVDAKVAFGEIAPAAAEVTTTSLGGYWSKYNTDLIIEVNSKAAYTYGERIGMRKVGEYYVISEIKHGGEASSGTVFDLVFITNSAFPGYADANIQAFIAAEVGQLVICEGDTSTGNVVLKLFSKENTVDCTVKVPVEHPTTYNVEQLPLDLVAPVVPEGKKFVGFYLDQEFETEEFFALPAGTLGDVTIYARVEDEDWVAPVYHPLYFVLNGGELEKTPTRYAEGAGQALPTPTREGYDFLGWTILPNSDEYITAVPGEENAPLTLHAHWKQVSTTPAPEVVKTIQVGAQRDITTLAAAMEVANNGDFIVLDPGDYEGAKVTKSVTIYGPNAGVNPNTEQRNEEANITSNLTIVADDVYIDGIRLTANGRIITTTSGDVKNLSVNCILVSGSTVNPNAETSSTAPLHLEAGSGFYIYNFSLTNSRFSDSSGRAMIAYIDGVDGMDILNNVFIGSFASYNDGIKTNNTRECIRGTVNIKYNHFEKYQQYVIWFRGFGGGDYHVIGNEFTKIGYTAGSHAMVNFISYKGAATDDLTVEIKHNVMTTDCYGFLRIDNTDALGADHTVEVAFNKYETATKANFLIKNASQMTVNAHDNYWGTATPDAGLFVGVKSNESLDDPDKVLSEEEAWYLDKLMVGADEKYTTLTAALADAKDGDTIIVRPGTYEEEVTIDKKVIILGPNANVKGAADRDNEAIFTKKMTISANEVMINGLKFTGNGNIVLNNVEGVIIDSIVMLAEPIKPGSDARGGQLVNTGTVSNLIVIDSYFNAGNKAASGRDNIVLSDYTATDIYIYNNYLGNEVAMANPDFYGEAVKITKPAGVIALEGNEIRYTTDNFIIFFGSASNDATKITVKNNILGAFESTANGTAGTAIRLLPAGAQLDIVHNYYLHHNGNVIDTKDSAAGAYISIMYNQFDENTALKWSNKGSANIEFIGNFYEKAPVSGHEPSDYGVIKSLEEMEEAYLLYLISLDGVADTELSYDLDGGIASDLPDLHVFGEDTPLPTPYKEGYKFLGWSLEKGSTNYVKSIGPKVSDPKLTLYANWSYICITVGEGGQYATLTEALAVAKEYDVIKVLPGTYDEDVVVSTNYLTIEGANAGIAYYSPRGEESIVKSITLAKGTRNITVDGIKFSGIMGMEIKGGKNFEVLNCLFGTTPTADGQSMIYGTGTIRGLLVSGCSFITDKGRTHYRAIRIEGSGVYCGEVTIFDNYFVNDCAASVYIDCVKLADLVGFVNISSNFFDWPGNNWTVFVGGGSAADGIDITFDWNTFASTKEAKTTMSGATFRNLKANTTLHVEGNVFSEVAGTVLQTNGGTAAHVTVKNNAFLNTSTKAAFNVLADNFVHENNYYYEAPNFTGTQKPDTANNAESSDAAEGAVKTHVVTFIPNPGVVQGSSIVKLLFIEGSILKVSAIAPTLSGKRIVGWYDNGLFEGEPVTELGAQKTDLYLYAKYEEIPTYKITYVLNGGEAAGLITSALEDATIKLPTPTKFGSTFLGWTLEAESTDYIKTLNVLEDTTVYAHWLDKALYDVKLVLNGGSVRYANRDELVADFIADYNRLMGTNWQTAADMGDSNFAPVSWHTFYEKDIDSKTTVRDKWIWLAEYLLDLSQRDLASNNCNVTGLKKLVNKGSYSGDDIYGLLYAFGGFLKGIQYRPGSSYQSVDFKVYENANGFWSKLSAAEEGTYQFTEDDLIPACHLENYKFVGWYDNAEFTGEAVTKVSANTTLYAKFEEENPVTKVEITNKVTELKKFATLQLEWTLTPGDAAVKNVIFSSSDESVATVDAFGLVTAVSEGTVTITITSTSGEKPTDTMTFEVFSPDHFEASYATESYTTVDGTLQLNAAFIKRDGSKPEISWKSEDETIAIVDGNGLVTAKGVGIVKITAFLVSNGSFEFDFYVTVVDDELSEQIELVLQGHNSNVFTRYELGIGSGKPAYYRDIYGDINDMMFNETLDIDTRYYLDGKTSADYYGGKKSSVEFITVHYTGNMSKGSTAAANANYFMGGGGGTSINYVTGNDGVFAVLDDAYVAYHAGDGTGVAFQWYDSGVDYTEGDPTYPTWGIVKVENKFYFTLNGKTTTYEVPDPKPTVTDNAKNCKTSAYWVFEEQYNDPKWFTSLGLPFKVENGKYYIGTTWWCYTQVLEGKICSRGGNLNSVGIESAVNPESDLWYTWDKTAQLCAYLMDKYDLDITRVQQHHFFSGKDCSQPFLANNNEIWWQFIDKVKVEYARITAQKDYTFSMTVAEDSVDYVSNLGRVTPGADAKVARYTVTIKAEGKADQTITLATLINGIYSKN